MLKLLTEDWRVTTVTPDSVNYLVCAEMQNTAERIYTAVGPDRALEKWIYHHGPSRVWASYYGDASPRSRVPRGKEGGRLAPITGTNRHNEIMHI